MTVDTAILLSSFAAAAVCIAVAAWMEWRDDRKRNKLSRYPYNRIRLHPYRDRNPKDVSG